MACRREEARLGFGCLLGLGFGALKPDILLGKTLRALPNLAFERLVCRRERGPLRSEFRDHRAERLRQHARLVVAIDRRKIDLAPTAQAFRRIRELEQRPRELSREHPRENGRERRKRDAPENNIPLQASDRLERQRLAFPDQHNPVQARIRPVAVALGKSGDVRLPVRPLFDRETRDARARIIDARKIQLLAGNIVWTE